MSRILLNNSNAVIQRAAAAAATTSGNGGGNLSVTAAAKALSTSSQVMPSAHVSRRWKSLLIHVNNRHRQQQQRHLVTSPLLVSSLPTSLAFSPAQNVNAHCSRQFSSNLYVPKYSRALSSSGNKREMSSANLPKCLSLENINPNFVTMEYAVRGPIVIRAGEIEKEMEQGHKKPFDYVIRANIGDCHAMGQKPISFLRQLLVCTLEPELMTTNRYPEDVKKRACAILEGCQGKSVGSYTDSSGIEVIRRQVADFIAERDGSPSDWKNIYLTAGATPGIKSVLSLLNCSVGGKKPGIMVPVPQYPLYSATLTEYGLEKIDYYLEEETGWSLTPQELQRSYDEAKKHCNPRAIVVINPGNPTGQVLTRKNIEEIIKFAAKNKVMIFADEVYQANIYDENSEFHSFKKVINEMGAPYNQLELASFMSASKGYLGECGIRGGYMEVVNMCPKVMGMLTKSITASLCSTTAGQVAISALVNPPKKGEPSYDQFMCEKNAILGGLKERAELVHKTLNSFEGYSTNKVMGAMYIFPQIMIPPKAIEEAKAKKMTPDAFYASQLLEATGICIVPGSGFGQKKGTYHFRSTILPQTPVLKDMMNKFQKFHGEFMQKYK